MSEFFKELEWKNHAPFFNNLNKDMDMLRAISRDVRDLRKLRLYYYELDNIVTHYACYIDEDLKSRLDCVSELIITAKYETFLSKKMPKDEYAEYYDKVLKSITELKSIHSEISKSLHDNELFPKIKKKNKKDKTKSLIS